MMRAGLHRGVRSVRFAVFFGDARAAYAAFYGFPRGFFRISLHFSARLLFIDIIIRFSASLINAGAPEYYHKKASSRFPRLWPLRILIYRPG
jgi:hypothetical protein